MVRWSGGRPGSVLAARVAEVAVGSGEVVRRLLHADSPKTHVGVRDSMTGPGRSRKEVRVRPYASAMHGRRSCKG